MSTFNLIILVIVSIFVLLGFLRGFQYKSLRSAAFFTGLIVAYFVGTPLSNLIMRTPLGYDFLTGAYLKNLDESSEVMTTLLNDDVTRQNNLLSLGLEEVKIPTLFHGFYISKVFITDSSVRVALASSFANMTIYLITLVLFFVGTFFIIRFFLKKVTDTFFGEKGNNLAGRLFGAVKGFAFASIIVTGLMFVIVLIDQIMVQNANLSFNDYLNKQFHLTDGRSYSLGKMYYNIALSLLNWISLI